MAGRTADISTSSFKPLSLDEIMAVPLAKRASEDKAQLALDEFASLEQNSLDIDKEYVAGQVGAFQGEADALSNQLIDQGVDRNLINKVRQLRGRKNKELSIHGKTGQAAAAFNQQAANKKAITSRGDLGAAQKAAGLAQSESNYTGVLEGGQYEDFVGTAHIDIMEKGRKIYDRMTPEQRAASLGMTVDENGVYSNNKYDYTTLTSEHIQKVIYQALKGDTDVMAYANELGDLGLQDPEKMIQDASISAGNVGQVNKLKDYSEPLNGGKPLVDPTEGMINRQAQWTTSDIPAQDGLWSTVYNLPSPKDAEAMFVNGQIPENTKQYDSEREERLRSERDHKRVTTMKSGVSWQERNLIMSDYDYNHKGYDTLSKEAKDLKATLNTMRENYPVLAGNKPAVMGDNGVVLEAARPWNDQEIYEIYSNGAKASEKSFSKVIKARNPSSTFYALGEKIVGSADRNGEFATKNMKLAGKISGGSDLIAKQLDLDQSKFNEIVRKTGRVIGFAPGHIDMPGAFAMQIELPDGSTPIVYVENDGKASQDLQTVSWMNEAIQNSEPYKLHQRRNEKGDVVNEHVITELNPTSKSYEAGIIRTQGNYTEEDINSMKFMRIPGRAASIAVDDIGHPIIPRVVKSNYNEEMQRSIKVVTDSYDSAAHQKTSINESELRR